MAMGSGPWHPDRDTCPTRGGTRQTDAQIMIRKLKLPLGAILYVFGAMMLSFYFVFAAVQGDYGVFRRAEVEAEADALRQELALLQAEVERMENLTTRLSDAFLDLDLLDEQARDVLGMIRADEVVMR